MHSRFAGPVAPARPVYRGLTMLPVLALLGAVLLGAITYVNPSTGRVPYLPDLYHQIDGTAFEQSNCVPSTTVTIVDRSTLGKWRLTPSAIRAKAGDTQGGMTYDDVAAAAHSLTGGDATLVVTTTNRAGLKSLVAAGHATGTSIDAGVTVTTPYHTGSYTGGHTLVVIQWRHNAALDRDEFLVGDPGRGTSTNPLGYVWWPAWLLYKAAEARSGSTAIYTLVARDTEGVTRAAAGAGAVRTGPAITSSKKGTLVAARGYSIISSANGGDWTIGTHTGHAWVKIKWGLAGTGWVAGGWLPKG